MGFTLFGNGKIGSGLIGMGMFGSDGGDESRVEGLETPKWWEDPDYRATQDKLKGLGTGILDGNIPDYYKGIGETGGPEFEKFLGLTNADAMRGAEESLAKSGRARGGSAAAVTSQAIADNSIKARYADYTRSLEGKKWLFGEGRGITEGVRTAGQTEGSRKNAFNLDVYDRQFSKGKYLDSYDRQASEDQGAGIGKLLNAAVGGVTGFMTGGPVGAAAGAIGGLTGTGATWLDALSSKKPSTTATTGAKAAAGVSSLGSIGNDSVEGFQDVLKKMFG